MRMDKLEITRDDDPMQVERQFRVTCSSYPMLNLNRRDSEHERKSNQRADSMGIPRKIKPQKPRGRSKPTNTAHQSKTCVVSSDRTNSCGFSPRPHLTPTSEHVSSRVTTP